ncbi:hypothetical protein HNR23_000784 [Nocardiopsis mwathae]|uniref:Regulatory protein n=1 Tax=Nocardiopsis mwathae TaxID=1472723 RepID=A0A7W9YEL1_9ACTN|nr:hypothetical protein [Nocardiopsis mwathae]MBB6170724.1 hypothetical protein [Nocardiopsis mwathae]
MRFPIDLSAVRVRVATPPEDDRDFETQQVKQNKDGRPMVRVSLMVLDGTEADVIRVRAPGPLELAPDDLVQVAGLRAQFWSMEGRSGLSFSADSVTRVSETASRAKEAK